MASHVLPADPTAADWWRLDGGGCAMTTFRETTFPDQAAYCREEWSRAAAIEAEFLRAHDVRPYRNSRHNLTRLLRSAGADADQVQAVRVRLGAYGAHSGAFDHGKIFGRDGVPICLIAHPYDLDAESLADLKAIQALGLAVEVRGEGESFYGWGTTQVIVVAPAAFRLFGFAPTGIVVRRGA
jgi:hypothetical protein